MSKMNSLSQYQSKNNLQTQRINLFSQLSQSTAVSKSTNIGSIIQCLICEESIRQAHMCPSCCKLFCQSCIKNWIRNKKPECPNVNCQKPLNNHNLLNCSILGRQIEQALSKSVSKIKSPLTSSVLQSPSGTKILFPKPITPIYESPPQPKNSEIVCSKHDLKLDYYCEQCLIGLCADCAVLSSNHHGHKLCKFSQKKLKYQETISKISQKIVETKRKFLIKKNEIVQWIEKLKIIQSERKVRLVAHLKYIYQKNLENHTKFLKNRQQNFDLLNQNYQMLSTKFNILQYQFQQKSKSKLVTEYQIMKRILNEQLQNMGVNENIQLPSVQNELLPQFEKKIYLLHDYDELRQKGQILISQPLLSKGTQWILKIFPGGINPEKGNDKYLAIHLQMSKGHQYFNWYRYRIQLVNQVNLSKSMSFEFQNDFKEGTQWPLDQFIRISSLYEQDFIHPEGYIVIVLYIRCLSYYHALRNQNELISSKQIKIEKNKRMIQILTKTAQQKGVKIWSKDQHQHILQNTQISRVSVND